MDPVSDGAGARKADDPETFGRAAERGLTFHVECNCGSVARFHAKDLARAWGKSRGIDRHRFKYAKCKSVHLMVQSTP